MVVSGMALTDMLYMMKPIPDVRWLMRRVEDVVLVPEPEVAGAGLYEMAFPKPSPFKSWGDYMSHKRKDFLVTESFQFGYMKISRTGHRTYKVDDGYSINHITGQSDEQAFDNLLRFMCGEVVTSARVQMVH
jgi:hypothetical protein